MLKGSPVIMTMGDNNDSEFVTKFDYTLPSTIQIYIRWARIHQSAGPTMNFHTTNPILKGLKNHMQEITQKGYNFFRWAWRNVKKISGSIQHVEQGHQYKTFVQANLHELKLSWILLSTDEIEETG